MNDPNASYERQLAHLKSIIPQLACPLQIHLCSVWIARFTSCYPDEEHHRSMLVNLFVRQLRAQGRLDAPFLSERTASLPLQSVVQEHTDRLLVSAQKYSGHREVDRDNREMCDNLNRALARFEYHLEQVGMSDQPYEHLRRLRFMEFLNLDDNYRPILERVQSRWNGIFANIQIHCLRPAESHTTAMQDTCASSSSSCTSSSSDTGHCGDHICTDPLHIGTPCTVESLPSKYKTFALKCAKRMEKMNAEMARLRQTVQIQASTEAIRFAALKSELVQSASAKQQADMSTMIDQLDERYREIIANSMALGAKETKKAKAT